MTTNQMLDVMKHEYGTYSWRGVQAISSGKSNVSKSRYKKIIIDKLFAKGDILFDGFDYKIAKGEMEGSSIYYRLLNEFFNRRNPSWVVDNWQDMINCWVHVNGRPNVWGSSYNFEAADFAKLYMRYGNGMLAWKVASSVNLNQRAEIATKLFFSRREKLAFRLLRMDMSFICFLKMADIVRVLKAPYEIRLLFATYTNREVYDLQCELIKKIEGSDGRWEVVWEKVQKALADKELLYSIAPKPYSWIKLQNFIPNDRELINLIDKKEIASFDKGTYLKAMKRFSSSMDKDNARACAIVAQSLFNKGNLYQFCDYINRHRGYNDHDIFSVLTKGTKDCGDYLNKHKDSNWDNLQVINHGWSGISEEEKTLPIGELTNIIKSKVYIEAQHLGFAKVAASFGIPDKKYYEWEEQWLNGIAEVNLQTIPSVSSKVNGYKMYMLDREDPRGLFLGLYTDCCQHPDGAGRSCAWHGATFVSGGFYVVEDNKGTIIAQSWTWRSIDTIVFDNIECLGSLEDRKSILKQLYVDVANKMLGLLCIKRVNLGTGYDEGDFIEEFKEADIYQKANPPRGYTDAKHQVILAEDPSMIEDPSITELCEFQF